MSRQKIDVFAPYFGQKLTPEEARIKYEEIKARIAQASAAARTVPQDPIASCPISVQQLCSHKKQDEFEKANGIAPGCSYYRRRHDAFVKQNPDLTPPTYYLEYGEKYCNRFTQETYDKLSPEGQEWLNKVKCGLQQKLEEKILEKPEIENSNKKFSDTAYKMHSEVYLKSGLAKLDLEDQVKIGATAWQEFVPFVGDNVGATWEQAGKVLPDIAEEKLKNALDLKYPQASDARIWDF